MPEMEVNLKNLLAELDNVRALLNDTALDMKGVLESAGFIIEDFNQVNGGVPPSIKQEDNILSTMHTAIGEINRTQKSLDFILKTLRRIIGE